MAKMTPKAAKLMTIAGAINCLISIIIMIFIFLGRSDLPIFIPVLLLITGIMAIFASLSYHTHK